MTVIHESLCKILEEWLLVKDLRPSTPAANVVSDGRVRSQFLSRALSRSKKCREALQ
jgi:hypothetical protein